MIFGQVIHKLFRSWLSDFVSLKYKLLIMLTCIWTANYMVSLVYSREKDINSRSLSRRRSSNIQWVAFEGQLREHQTERSLSTGREWEWERSLSKIELWKWRTEALKEWGNFSEFYRLSLLRHLRPKWTWLILIKAGIII